MNLTIMRTKFYISIHVQSPMERYSSLEKHGDDRTCARAAGDCFWGHQYELLILEGATLPDGIAPSYFTVVFQSVPLSPFVLPVLFFPSTMYFFFSLQRLYQKLTATQ